MAHFLNLHQRFTSPSGFPQEDNVNKSRCCLPPEVEEGNVEYKLKLVRPSETRLEHLTTQLKWRLQEGQGEAIYEIGVEDNGLLAGLTREEMRMSLDTLTQMAAKLRSEATVLRERIVDGDAGEDSERVVAEVLVRKVPDDQQFIDVRLAVIGNVDVGKSTLVGVLTQGELDNGRGRARLNLFRHLHEIESGRTSSISHEILGFDSKGQVVNYRDSASAEEICEMSSKIVTFLDLAGHQKYLKTTIFGLTGHIPDFAMLIVAANAGVVGTSREHLALCMALDVPMFIVINKTDVCTAAMTERTIKSLERVLKSPGCRKIPLQVQNADDVVVAATNLAQNRSATPIFTVSSVSGQDLDLLKQFLNMIPPRQSQEEQERLMQEEPEYLVDETFNVPGTGLVVGGTLMRGLIREGDVMMLGPSEQGSFQESKVMSIRRNRAPCRLVKAGQSATLALSGVDKTFLRRGMALLSQDSNLVCSSGFEANFFLLFHTTMLSERFQGTIHVGKIVQTVVAEKISQRIKTGQWATVTFKFMRNPEFIRTGSKIFFRQGRTKAMGTIMNTIPFECDGER